jgi:hypothetical protein
MRNFVGIVSGDNPKNMEIEPFEIDQYKPELKGVMPVRVLSFTYVQWFIEIDPSFREVFEAEVDINNFKNYITYRIEEKPIETVAELSNNNEIILYENYNQFLWDLSYSLIVIFDEGIHKPALEGNFDGHIANNIFTNESFELFFYAMSLLKKYSLKKDYRLPNPEKYSYERKEYIEKCNGIFTSAMVFILLHEFAHQYFGHNQVAHEKKFELDADDYAFDYLSKHFDGDKGKTMQLGIVAGLSSLILLDNSMSGGKEHPDPDYRLRRLLERMALDPTSNLWWIASLSFIMWGKYYDREISLPGVLEDSRTLFNKIIEETQLLKLQD